MWFNDLSFIAMYIELINNGVVRRWHRIISVARAILFLANTWIKGTLYCRFQLWSILVCACKCVFMRVCMFVCTWSFVQSHVCMNVYAHTCLCMSRCALLCVKRVLAFARVDLHVRACMCACIHVSGLGQHWSPNVEQLLERFEPRCGKMGLMT